MKVVFTTLFREGMGGGAGRVAEELSEAFARHHQVLFILPGLRTQIVKKPRSNLIKLRIKSLGKEDIAIPVLNIKNINFIFKNLDRFAPEIIHAQDPGPISLVAQIWAIKHRVPFVYTSHILPTKSQEFTTEELSYQFGKLLHTKTLRKYFLDFFNTSDALIALNQEAKKDIIRFGFKGRIFVIPNGRNLHDYKRCLPANINDKKKILTFVGGLSKRKNQQYLLRVMQYLPTGFVLNLIGEAARPKILEELRNYAAKKRIGNVNFVGRVDNQEIPKHLAQTHFFVSASKIEVQSLAIIEALASGRPVIGLANETIDEFVDKSVGFRLKKNTSPQEFAQKIKQLASLSQKSYEQLYRNARQRVARLDWFNVVQQTVKAYGQLIAEKKREKTFEKVDKISSLEEILFSFKKLGTNRMSEKQKEPIWKRNDLLSLYLVMVITFISGYLYEFVGSLKKLKRLILEQNE